MKKKSIWFRRIIYLSKLKFEGTGINSIIDLIKTPDKDGNFHSLFSNYVYDEDTKI